MRRFKEVYLRLRGESSLSSVCLYASAVFFSTVFGGLSYVILKAETSSIILLNGIAVAAVFSYVTVESNREVSKKNAKQKRYEAIEASISDMHAEYVTFKKKALDTYNECWEALVRFDYAGSNDERRRLKKEKDNHVFLLVNQYPVFLSSTNKVAVSCLSYQALYPESTVDCDKIMGMSESYKKIVSGYMSVVSKDDRSELNVESINKVDNDERPVNDLYEPVIEIFKVSHSPIGEGGDSLSKKIKYGVISVLCVFFFSLGYASTEGHVKEDNVEFIMSFPKEKG